MTSNGLFTRARECLAVSEVEKKLNLTASLYKSWQTANLRITGDDYVTDIVCRVPEKPELVEPGRLSQRNIETKEGHAALIHSIAHIEFSAINLALDAVARFRDMPREYYTDWVRIADEERQHFLLLENRLQELGFSYGDFPAHAGLWRVAEETAHDPLLRMALVPRVLEAKGLDVTPGISKRFEKIKDIKTVKILNRIFADEITHVAAGSRWFLYLCNERGLESESTFIKIIREEFKGNIKGPFVTEARLKAGFSEFELDRLENLAASLS